MDSSEQNSAVAHMKVMSAITRGKWDLMRDVRRADEWERKHGADFGESHVVSVARHLIVGAVFGHALPSPAPVSAAPVSAASAAGTVTATAVSPSALDTPSSAMTEAAYASCRELAKASPALARKEAIVMVCERANAFHTAAMRLESCALAHATLTGGTTVASVSAFDAFCSLPHELVALILGFLPPPRPACLSLVIRLSNSSEQSTFSFDHCLRHDTGTTGQLDALVSIVQDLYTRVRVPSPAMTRQYRRENVVFAADSVLGSAASGIRHGFKIDVLEKS